ncbi:hypothetical protein JHD49_05615 [Sulfurimonas sp. SAG-AH-194-C21]|nr:hypothetical protein [Sulfurimonas sp. SAG-AH-194-C21]MDF1883415.1 hypothetical protein [Sulfurimonas sp. SAG-AH-194-C21]
MKKIVLTALLGATTSLMALGAEHAYIYKDPRIMGMGGANIAVGGYSSSIFSNPAGLSSIKQKEGFVVDIFSLGVTASSQAQDFISDLNNAGNDTTQIEAVLQKYSGDAFNVSANNYSAISKNSDFFAWSIGILAAAEVNYIVHANGSANGAALEVAGRTYGGVVTGASKDFHTSMGEFDIGFGAKFITQKSYEGPIYTSDLTQDNALENLQNKYEKTASGIGGDIGLTYKPFGNKSFWNPAFGVSLLNIGSIGMDDNYGGQPMTVNLGASISPEVSFLSKLVLAVDYVDVMNASTTRVYTYAADIVTYKDYSENDPMKRLRLGAGFGLVNTSLFMLTLNGGLYNSSYTAGIDMAFSILKLNAATYKEQIGTGEADIPDRRYMVQVGIGW